MATSPFRRQQFLSNIREEKGHQMVSSYRATVPKTFTRPSTRNGGVNSQVKAILALIAQIGQQSPEVLQPASSDELLCITR